MFFFICVLVYSLLCISVPAFHGHYGLIVLVGLTGIVINVFSGSKNKKIYTRQHRILNHGVVCLKIFCISTMVSIVFHIYYLVNYADSNRLAFVISIINSFLLLLIMFWNGIITVYLSSSQLGIKHRVIGILLGLIPIANVICLFYIISICSREIKFESYRIELNEQRKNLQVCKTKYPILMVHGVFFRDRDLINYWGRIPKELEANGATIYYGNHSSALSVLNSSKELEERINEIVLKTQCEKVNIIAHSKGGLDARAALSSECCKYIASVTTINTPHKGCEFADYLLNVAPQKLKESVTSAYNFAAKKLGDKEPDFLAAVTDLTHSRCIEFNKNSEIPSNVFCQSFGSVLRGAKSPRFPLNLTYKFVKSFDGDHDGLVSTNSFEFGEKYTLLKPKGKRGISHADVIDLNRENIPGFDIREFYVGIVSDLKDRGL